jgi:hypothetical protein
VNPAGTPDFITASACNPNSNFLPAPYGTLAANVLATDTTITVNTTTPALQAVSGTPPGSVVTPATPFDIVLGVDGSTLERMTVNGITGPANAQVWAVTRGVAFPSTPGLNLAIAHTAPLLVMSTPLPLIATTQGQVNEYVMGNQAQICISAQGGGTTTFFDIGDAWNTHP